MFLGWRMAWVNALVLISGSYEARSPQLLRLGLAEAQMPHGGRRGEPPVRPRRQEQTGAPLPALRCFSWPAAI